ncbi:TylF/MycF/NovP-related O-methyltransferase [Herpetosiphon sp. NSE202]|uniref:TylF/MycF/NovP-related O-methyltransferase n=1 Tax=Herpetosiphon sp. NSE202 TaxID=3351349 RepID=UPI00363A49BF
MGIKTRFKNSWSTLANTWRLSSLNRMHPKLVNTIKHVQKQHLTYLDPLALIDLGLAVRQLEQQGIAGQMLELGCAAGGSAIVITSVKAKQRPFAIYDVFGMIPPPSERDGQDVHQRYEVISTGKSPGLGNRRYYGYEEELDQKVIAAFTEAGYPIEQHHVHLVKGLYEDSLQIDQPVAFAHIDCDWYDSVMVCLERIVPHLVQGGILVIDDYTSWSGCRHAIDDFFRNRQAEFRFEHKSRLHITRR